MGNGRDALTTRDYGGPVQAGVKRAQARGGDPQAAPESDFSPRKLRIAAAILIGQTFATSLLPFAAFSLVMIPLTRQFGWSRTDFSFAQTCIMFFGALSLWPIGRLTDKFGIRPVIIAGTAVVGLVTLAMSLQTRSLAQLYVFYGLLGVFGSTGVAYTKLAAALFTQNRGKALVRRVHDRQRLHGLGRAAHRRDLRSHPFV